jgi:diguanylate cyclase (GGDEF)-like protein/PAS domain S-box-containing protein
MMATRILVVEDEGIIARQIKNNLQHRGYEIIDVLTSGQQVLEKAPALNPDLVLMDISLSEGLDGIETAALLKQKMDVPIIYLTAYGDDVTLNRAKTTDPDGYILKPFSTRTLYTTIEIALNKFEIKQKLSQSEQRFRTLVENQSEGFSIMDNKERFVFANPAAEMIFGASHDQLIGSDVRAYMDQENYQKVLEQTDVRRQNQKSAYEVEILRNHHERRLLSVTATPWLDKNGAYLGAFAIFRDITETRQAEIEDREQHEFIDALRDTAAAITSTLVLSEVFERILSNVNRVAPHDAANIMLVTDNYAQVIMAKGYEGKIPHSEEVLTVKFKILQTLTMRQMVQTGQAILISDAYNYPEWEIIPATEWVRSYVGAPIQWQGKIIGFINLDSSIPGFFTQKHMERLQAFANQVAVAVENARLFDETQRRAFFLSSLNEITRSALAEENTKKILDNLAQQVSHLLSSDSTYISLWNEENQTSSLVAFWGLITEAYRTKVFKQGEKTLTLSVLEQNCPLAIPNIFDTPYIDPEIAKMIPSTSVLGLPLATSSQKLGALMIGFEFFHNFTQEEIIRGEQLAGQVALVIAKTRSLEMEKQKSEQLLRANTLITALSHVAAAIETAPDPDSLLETLGNELYRIGVMCVVSLLSQDQKYLMVRYTSLGMNALTGTEMSRGVTMQDIRLPVENYPHYSELILKRKPIFIADSQSSDSLTPPGFPPTLAIRLLGLAGLSNDSRGVFLPMIVGDNVIGVLRLWGDALRQEDLSAISIFASQVSVSLENARLYNTIQQLAITDDLTGLYNRRGFAELGRHEIYRARRFNRPLTLIWLDIDHFKEVNDTFGHATGDEVLRKLAETLRTSTRETDLVSRLGGDEFVALLPETTQHDAIQVAERFRQAIKEIAITGPVGTAWITTSLGVASLTADDNNLDALLERADTAMYAAKKAGRNRVMVL